jgi:hypothetical protein
MLGSRTLISLSQFLDLQEDSTIALMFQKCGIQTPRSGMIIPNVIFTWLKACGAAQINELVDEIFHSTRMLRAAVNPKYLYEERWTDLERCLLLDGYRIIGDYRDGYKVVAVEPTIAETAPLGDDLSNELKRSNLSRRGWRAPDHSTAISMAASPLEYGSPPPDIHSAREAPSSPIPSRTLAVATTSCSSCRLPILSLATCRLSFLTLRERAAEQAAKLN